MEKQKMILDVNEKPQIAKWVILAFQHVFAMFGATVLVPLLVNQAAGKEVLSTGVALISSGIGTLIYILCTKGKSPVYLGSSFAFIAPIGSAFLLGGISRCNDWDNVSRINICYSFNNYSFYWKRMDK